MRGTSWPFRTATKRSRTDGPSFRRCAASPPATSSRKRARSSAVEHTLHTGGVTGSIPVAPTIVYYDKTMNCDNLYRAASGFLGVLGSNWGAFLSIGGAQNRLLSESDGRRSAVAAAEHALAHVIGDKAEQAYRRDDELEIRRPIMVEWGASAKQGTCPAHPARVLCGNQWLVPRCHLGAPIRSIRWSLRDGPSPAF